MLNFIIRVFCSFPCFQKQKKVKKNFGPTIQTFIEHIILLVGVVPGEPADVVVTEATKSYVVLAWKPPVQRGHEGVVYYIEKVRKRSRRQFTAFQTQDRSIFSHFLLDQIKYLLAL